MTRGRPGTRRVAVAVGLALLLGLAVLPGTALAETRTGGTITVGPDETVAGDLHAVGGAVVVEGTVEGDLEAYAGEVRIAGTVTGDVDAVAGSVRVDGTIGGGLDAAAGSVAIGPGASIDGPVSAAGGSVDLAGAVGANAYLAGGAVRLGETATVGGDVVYAVGTDGQFVDEGASVAGTVARSDRLRSGPFEGPILPGWVLGTYGFLVNLLLGAVLLLVLPRFSDRVADRVHRHPLHAAGLGLLLAVAIPILLLLLAVTVVGLPLALLGALGFVFGVWVALVYGRFAVGAWLLSLLDVEGRWLALVVGLFVGGVLARLPIVGGLLDLVVVLLGLGGVAAVAYSAGRYRRPRGGL